MVSGLGGPVGFIRWLDLTSLYGERGGGGDGCTELVRKVGMSRSVGGVKSVLVLTQKLLPVDVPT